MLKKLHKIIGVSVCIIIIHLAITGIILMYPYTFRLHDTYFTNNFLYSLYDMHNLSEVKTIESSEDIGLVSSKIIVSDVVLETNINDIISLLKQDNYIYLLNRNSLTMIEEKEYGLQIVKEKALSFSASSIGIINNEAFVKSIDDNYYKIHNDLNISLNEVNNIKYQESRLIIPDKELSIYFLNQIQGPGIQALRLVADLHNGRFFGPIVMIIFFISSFFIIFLAISGAYMTIRPSIKRYYYMRKKKNRF